MQKFKTDYGKEASVGLPEIVFIGTHMGGNKELYAEALAANQVKRYMVNGQPWCRYSYQEAGTYTGRTRTSEHEQFGEVDEETAKSFITALDELCWELPQMQAEPARLALIQGKTPDSCYVPLEEAIEVTV